MRLHWRILLAALLAAESGVRARIFDDVASFPGKSYDFVIVGGEDVHLQL
jgi:hypothetical protein